MFNFNVLIPFIMCDLFNQHYYESTIFLRWLVTGDNWVCRRCGKAIKSVKELKGSRSWRLCSALLGIFKRKESRKCWLKRS